jgi:hypothetical protein
MPRKHGSGIKRPRRQIQRYRNPHIRSFRQKYPHWTDSSGNSSVRTDASRWSCKKQNPTEVIVDAAWSVDCERYDNYWIRRTIVVYYESIKRELKTKTVKECRDDERLKTKSEESTRLLYTGLLGELEHLNFLKIKMRLIDEMFASVMGGYVFLER